MEFFFLEWKASITLQLTNPYHSRNTYTGDIYYNSYQAIMLIINRCQIIMLTCLSLTHKTEFIKLFFFFLCWDSRYSTIRMPPKAAKMSCWLLCSCSEYILDGQFPNSCGSAACFHLQHTVTQHDFNRSLSDNSPWPSCLSSKSSYLMLTQPKTWIWWWQRIHMGPWGMPGGTHPVHKVACLSGTHYEKESALKPEVWPTHHWHSLATI